MHWLVKICQGQVILIYNCLNSSDFDCHILWMFINYFRKLNYHNILIRWEFSWVMRQLVDKLRFDIYDDCIRNDLLLLGYYPIIEILRIVTISTLDTQNKLIAAGLVPYCLHSPRRLIAKSDQRGVKLISCAVTTQMKCAASDWAILWVLVVEICIPVYEACRCLNLARALTKVQDYVFWFKWLR